MIPNETMTWAGPLPPDYADPDAADVGMATLAGPFETDSRSDLAAGTASETMMWTGALPPAFFETAPAAAA